MDFSLTGGDIEKKTHRTSPSVSVTSRNAADRRKSVAERVNEVRDRHKIQEEDRLKALEEANAAAEEKYRKAKEMRDQKILERKETAKKH
jgi:membrane protein involved in colicin uptake